jgi:hypothetical protein
MSKSKVNPFEPKNLTTEQRLVVDKLIAKLGDKHTNVKFADLRKASFELFNIAFPPAWISRNMNVRNQEKRGRYDLSVLLKLPVVAFKEEVKKTKKAPKAAAPKAKKVKPLKTVPVIETVEVEKPVDDLDGIPLLPPTAKKPRKKKEVETQDVEVPTEE